MKMTDKNYLRKPLDFDQILKDEQLSIDYIASYLKILTNVEKGIIQFLSDLGEPMSIKGLRNTFIQNIANYFAISEEGRNYWLWNPDIMKLSGKANKEISEKYTQIIDNTDKTPTEKIRETNKYHCHRCDKYFCYDHRLPEDHNCPGLKNREEKKNKLKEKLTESNISPKPIDTPIETKKEQIVRNILFTFKLFENFLNSSDFPTLLLP